MSDPKYKTVGTPAMRLVEECGEMIQAISKWDRFGWGHSHPDRTATNLDELWAEWNDLNEAYFKLIDHIVTTKH
jgi:hypothetical protein